ncbi:MAG: Hsp20/alpha crystallin family protein [Myxococcota bacterium]
MEYNRHYTPATDIFQSDDGYLLHLDVPGVAQAEIDLTVEGRHLTVRAGGADDETPRWWRRFNLPRTVDVEAVEAQHRDGVLAVRLPLMAKDRTRRVAITAG